MNIETLEFAGLESALHAMRNPMDSWKMSDSKWELSNKLIADSTDYVEGDYIYHTGDKDKDLSVRLQTSGPEHCKHLRMVIVWADIAAPRYWWQEFDTYRAGVEKVSCSTMHRLMARPLELSDFECDCAVTIDIHQAIDLLNSSMKLYQEAQDPEMKKTIWRGIIQMLPQSYIQKRTVMMSYAVLRNICRQREGHKLKEWRQFLDWTRTLPESWMIHE